MSYSKYSDYSSEQIVTEDYQKLCDILLSKASNEQVLEKMKRYII